MEKQPTLLPDFGKHLAAKGTAQKTLLIYTSWEMDTLSVGGLGRYCTTRVQPQDGDLYCATFDFGDDVLREILKAATTETRDLITEKLIEDPASIRNIALPTPISVGIGAVLCDLQQGLHELFIPLLITQVFGVERASEYIYGKTKATTSHTKPPTGAPRKTASVELEETRRRLAVPIDAKPSASLGQQTPGRHPGLQLEDAKKQLAELREKLAKTPDKFPLLQKAREAKVQTLESEIRAKFGAETETVRRIVPSKRPFRWGKFQGWVMVVVGLITCLPPFWTHPGVNWVTGFVVGLDLILLGWGLAKRKRFGLVLLYLNVPILLFGIVFLSLPALEVIFVSCWYFVPAVFYYPKRWGEFSHNTLSTVSSDRPSANEVSLSHSALIERLKSAGEVLLCILALSAVVAVVGAFLGAAEVLSDYVLPWSIRISQFAFFVLILILLPLSLIRKCRPFASMAALTSSYVFGATVWMDSLVLTMTIWGNVAVIIGLIFLGVGIVPIAMLATLLHGMWTSLAELVVLTVLTFGSRFLAFWLVAMLDSEG